LKVLALYESRILKCNTSPKTHLKKITFWDGQIQLRLYAKCLVGGSITVAQKYKQIKVQKVIQGQYLSIIINNFSEAEIKNNLDGPEICKVK